MTFFPTCSVIGHVDVGKTCFLDFFKHKKTNEVRGITQQLTAYRYDKQHLGECIKSPTFSDNFKLDGIILIDTPGHEYFSQMRSVTSSISHLVIVMIDIIKGVEPTHKEILKYLRENHIDFIIILNKLDRISEWQCLEKQSLKNTFKSQTKQVMKHLQDYTNQIVCQLAENEINACLYYNNTDYKTFISMIPLSSKSGEGVSDFLMVISKIMEKKIKLFGQAEFYKNIRGFIVDSKIDDKFGKIFTVISHSNFTEHDILNILDKNNKLHKQKSKHLILNNIRAEHVSRDEIIYITFDDKNIDFACGDIILQNDIDNDQNYNKFMLSQITLNFNDTSEGVDNTEKCETEDISVMENEKLKLDRHGITIISLSKMMHGALYKMFKQDMNTPIAICTVDKINKNTIIKTINNNMISEKTQYYNLVNMKYDYYRVIIIFEPVLKEQYIDSDLMDFAQKNKLSIIGSNSIYRLREKYQQYCEGISQKIRMEYSRLTDCEVEIIPNCVFMKTSPLLIGVRVKSGILNIRTRLIALKNDSSVVLGIVKSIEKDKKSQSSATISEEVCIKIECIDKKIIYKTDFDESFKIITHRTKDEDVIVKMFENELKKPI